MPLPARWRRNDLVLKKSCANPKGDRGSFDSARIMLRSAQDDTGWIAGE
jgi:hypothetical protein